MRKGLAALVVSSVKDAASLLTILCCAVRFRRPWRSRRGLVRDADSAANGLMPLGTVQISEYGTQFLRFGWTALRKVHIGPKLVADVMCIAQYLISQTQTVWHGVVDTVINAGQLGKFACTRNGFGIEQHNWSKVK